LKVKNPRFTLQDIPLLSRNLSGITYLSNSSRIIYTTYCIKKEKSDNEDYYDSNDRNVFRGRHSKER
jgi:hypothetical protein